MSQQPVIEGTPAQLALSLGKLSSGKRYRVVEIEEAKSAAEVASNPEGVSNTDMLTALREIAERQKGRRHTDGSQTERLLRGGRAGAMWGCEPGE